MVPAACHSLEVFLVISAINSNIIYVHKINGNAAKLLYGKVHKTFLYVVQCQYRVIG